MSFSRTLLASLLALAAGACDASDPVAEGAEDTTILNAEEAGAGDGGIPVLRPAGEEEPPTASPRPSDPPTLPAQYRGRWALVSADCEPGRADSKGLMTIGEQSIYFYESVGELKQRLPSVATSFSGLFVFTGEGQSWDKVMTFTRTGDTLVRAEKEGRFTYKRCA